MTEREKIVEVMARGIEDAFWADLSSDAIAESALTALEASGMAVVPREPTPEMMIAGLQSMTVATYHNGYADRIWAAMLSAASPTPSMTENADE